MLLHGLRARKGFWGGRAAPATGPGDAVSPEKAGSEGAGGSDPIGAAEAEDAAAPSRAQASSPAFTISLKETSIQGSYRAD